MKSGIDKSNRELKGFAKVSLEPGQSQTVPIRLTRKGFAHFEKEKGKSMAEPGEFEPLPGNSFRDIRLKEKVTIE